MWRCEEAADGGLVVGLDGNGNGQNHYPALYTLLPFPVVPSDNPLKDEVKRTVQRPPPNTHTQTLHSHLQATAEINGCQSGRHTSSDDVCSISRNMKGVPV